MDEARRGVVRDFFHSNSEAWLRRYYKEDFDSVTYQDRMTEALRMLQRFGHPGMFILDGGCGAGVQSAAMEELGHQVVACDMAPGMARLAARNVPRVTLACLDRLPFPDASFDAVVMLGVLGYADDPDAVMTSVNRVLRPGGLLVISTAAERLLLARISDAISYLPDLIYRSARRLTLRQPTAEEEAIPGFYKKHCAYLPAKGFDRYIEQWGMQRLGGAAVNFGQLHFMGKRLFSERADIWLTRFLTRVSRHCATCTLGNHARIYVSAFRRASS